MIKLKITWKYCLAFYCIGMLYASLHELIHHFVAFLVCGEFGYKSFNYFEAACEKDAVYLFATLSGPIFTYAVMWVGYYFLSTGSYFRRHLGFAMIFAQLPLQRITGPLFYQNDEWYAVSKLWGSSSLNWWVTLIVILVLTLPPLVKAFKSIENKRAWAWFLFYFILFPYILVGPFFFLLEYLMTEKGVLSQTFMGIGSLFLLNEVVTIIAYFFTKKYIQPNQ